MKVIVCLDLLMLLAILHAIKGSDSDAVHVQLEMPRYASRGSNITLVCKHNAAKELVYRVEWRRAGGKLFQYVRGRNPSPFREFPTQGAHINVLSSNERRIVLQNVQFAASGSYSCEVSLDAPIYTKSSAEKELLVIQPQRHPPHMTFNSEVYTISDKLVATCTTSPAYPAPHITWLINGEKVDIVYVSSVIITRRPIYLRTTTSSTTTTKTVSSVGFSLTTISTTATTRICSSAQVNKSLNAFPRQLNKKPSEMDERLTATKTHPPVRSNRLEALQYTITKLMVPVSNLNFQNNGKLQITCLSTIPAYRGPSGGYADSKNRTITVEVTLADEQETTTSTEAYQNGCLNIKSMLIYYFVVFWCQRYLLPMFSV